MGLMQSVEGPTSTKKATLPQVKENSSVRLLSNWDVSHFFCLWAWYTAPALPVSGVCEPSHWNYTTVCPDSPAYGLTMKILGFVSLHNHMNQVFIINFYFLSIHSYLPSIYHLSINHHLSICYWSVSQKNPD